MIAITLNFKSIEAARQALLDIPQAALVGGPAPEAVQETKPAPKAQKAVAAATSRATAEKGAVSVEYPALQKAVFALAGKSREAAAAVAAGMDVKTFKELPQDKWAEALVAVNAKLAELEAA